MSQTKLIANLYNPHLLTKDELISNFVIRQKEFKDIFNDIKSSSMEHPEQHYIIQGPRGTGKTTLLLRIYYEIKNDPALIKRLIPLRFNEEQYHIRTLCRLWENTIELLEGHKEFNGLYGQVEELQKREDYNEVCFDILSNALKEKQKKIILFIDNIGDILNKFTETENNRLREILLTSSDIRIIGASSVTLEHTYDYEKPFYDFFKFMYMKELNSIETRGLLLKLSEQYHEDAVKVKEILEKQPERVEALRRLTGGIPRTIVLLFEIFADDKSGDSFKDLEIILDRVTPLYKHRMEDLSPQQQEIVDVIAMNWDAISTKDIAHKTRMQSKAVSAQLKQLEKNRVIHKIETHTKNYLYQITERFFNIWYLMRCGRRMDRNKVIWLVRFLKEWCSKDELIARAKRHLEYIQKDCNDRQDPISKMNLILISIWNNKIEEAIAYLKELLPDVVNIEEYGYDIKLSLLLLLAKQQYHTIRDLFKDKKLNLKDRFRPIYYALMYFMQDEYPNEYKKMGDELKETVEEIIQQINQMSKDYA